MKHTEPLHLDYVEGRLAAEQRAEVDAHLAACPSCLAEVGNLRQAVAALNAVSREMNRLPVNSAKGWQAVRRRVGEPIVARVRRVSRLSLQAAVSAAIFTMAFLSGISLNIARAAGPEVPHIETPGTVLAAPDTPTLSATHAATAETPTLTRTPIIGTTH